MLVRLLLRSMFALIVVLFFGGCDALQPKKRITRLHLSYASLDASASALESPARRCKQLGVSVRHLLSEYPGELVRVVAWRSGSKEAPEPVSLLKATSPKIARRASKSERARIASQFVDRVERACLKNFGPEQQYSPILRMVRRLSAQLRADADSLPKNTQLAGLHLNVFSDLRDGDDKALAARIKELKRRQKGWKPVKLAPLRSLSLPPATMVQVCGFSEVQARTSDGTPAEVVLAAWKPIIADAVVRPLCDVGSSKLEEGDQ